MWMRVSVHNSTAQNGYDNLRVISLTILSLLSCDQRRQRLSKQAWMGRTDGRMTDSHGRTTGEGT